MEQKKYLYQIRHEYFVDGKWYKNCGWTKILTEAEALKAAKQELSDQQKNHLWGIIKPSKVPRKILVRKIIQYEEYFVE